jgi:nucleoside-diphosphate-sugar epimerase
LGAEKTELMSAGQKIKRPEKVLVTGGGGFLGGAICRRLVNRGADVRSLSRNSYSDLEAMGIEQIQGDIGNPEIVEKACNGRELVFHTAAKPPPWGGYADYYRTNVTGTRNVIQACLKLSVPRLIYTSTPSVVFDGTDIEGANESIPYPPKYTAFYPQTKALAEKQIVKAAGNQLRTVALRPHQIWGPGDPHFVPRLIARAKKLKRIGSGKNLVDTTYIDNAAEAHILAADQLNKNAALSGNIYFISQGDPIPAWDMIDAILTAAGKSPVKGVIPYKIAWTIGAALEFSYRAFKISKEPLMTRFLADAVAKSHWFDISAARRDLGYVAKISTEEGLRRLEQWLNRKK